MMLASSDISKAGLSIYEIGEENIYFRSAKYASKSNADVHITYVTPMSPDRSKPIPSDFNFGGLVFQAYGEVRINDVTRTFSYREGMKRISATQSDALGSHRRYFTNVGDAVIWLTSSVR